MGDEWGSEEIEWDEMNGGLKKRNGRGGGADAWRVVSAAVARAASWDSCVALSSAADSWCT